MFGAKKKLKKMIESSFGINPLESYLFYNAENRLDKVRRFHNAIVDQTTEEWKVDDITWNDLEMDRVFLRINHTNSFVGEQMLYHRLHLLDKGSNCENAHELEKRLSYLKENPNERLEIETQINCIGKQEEGYYLAEFLLNSDWWKIGNTMLYHILQVLFVVCFGIGFGFNNIPAIAGGICIAFVNLMIYLRSKQKYEIYFNSLADFKRLYDFARWIEGKDKTCGNFVTDEVRNAIHSLKKMSGVIYGMNSRRQASMTGDVVAILREYIWGMLLIDVSMFNHIMKIIKDKQEEILQMFWFVGELDTDIAILSYRESVSGWCYPEFTEEGIVGTGFAHPLIAAPVKNDFTLEKRAIITGANASGKSTFMKAVAINCILAQTIHTCIAEQMRLQPMQIVTCMSLRDDVLTGESYYFREARYLKRMLELVADKAAVLLVIDEMLKGTNTKERVAASKAILDYIGNSECMALVATHDNELTENSLYKDYHFSSRIQGKDIVFDYLIQEGINEQSNAIALLSYLGYPESIVEKAKVNMYENR